MAKFNLGSIFDTFQGWLGIGKKSVDDGVPVAKEVVKNASDLFDIIKGAFAGKQPTEEQIAASDASRRALADQLAKS